MFQMQRYDFFLLISATRFSENDAWLANKIRRMGRSCFYVRTKIAADISNDKKAHPRRAHDEEAVISEIRENVVTHLEAGDNLLYAVMPLNDRNDFSSKRFITVRNNLESINKNKTLSCFADWSKCCHVTFIIIEC